MNFRRSGGILLHPTSLPGPYGIGDLGPQAYRFIDWLSDAGCRLWQVLPLGPTGYGDSPYQCFSAFAGNPYLISPDVLVQDGLLKEADLTEVRGAFATNPDADVDYGLVIPHKLSLLGRAFQSYQDSDPIGLREEFEEFRNRNAAWLNDYSFFMALKEETEAGPGSIGRSPFGSGTRRPSPPRARHWRRRCCGSLFTSSFSFVNGARLQAYAHHKDLTIIGDIPIFVAEDSSDVWAHPELFHLDEERRSTVVAGVPPDYFSPTGQLWGNPLYKWDEHERTHYDWWLKRFQAILNTVDIVRLDHFRGFAGYWEIPAGNPTAEFGRWVQGPGADLFEVIRQSLKGSAENADLPIIAEDLGFITEDVVQLREQFRLPGMRILQFGFSGPDNPFLPHMYVKECVAYTGTHDNDTARGWFESAPKAESRFALRYLHTTARTFAWDMVRAIWSSVAVFAIAPLQDLLDLGPEARMNYPSRLGGNWKWRLKRAT